MPDIKRFPAPTVVDAEQLPPATAATQGAMSAAQNNNLAGLIDGTLLASSVSQTNLLITDGDSISAPWAESGDADPRGLWQIQASSLLTGSWTIINTAVNGRALVQMQDAAYVNVDCVQSRRARRNVVVIWGGTNDPTDNTDANVAAAYARLVAYCRARNKTGATVIVVTMASRQPYVVGGVTIDWEAWGARYNALIRKGKADGTILCDAVADIALDANLGGIGAYLNTTYFPDQIHLNRAPDGALLAAQIISSAINSALSTDVLAPTNVALNKTYSCSPAPNGAFSDNGGAQLTDGLIRAQLAGAVEASVGWNSDPTITIDLGSLKNVCRARDYHGGSGVGDVDSPASIIIQTSPDNVTYTTVISATYPTETGEGWDDFYFQSAPARYVKFVMTRRPLKWLTLGELEVYAY
jgi:hypothetical protein